MGNEIQNNEDLRLELKEFLDEARGALEELKKGQISATKLYTRLRKTLTSILVIAGIIFIPFLYSFIDINVRIAKVEESKMPEDEVYQKFVQKTDALAVHMFERDWVKTQLFELTHKDEYKKDGQEDQVEAILKAFYKINRRGGTDGTRSEN